MDKKVLVIGGGIAGIQAALDLADKGVDVKLVERNPSIGGRMAQLDKTFPTNDCSICILAPKMADCYSHPNIDVMTYSELDSVEGEAGDFEVTVRHKARYVDLDKCTGCGDCFDVCPTTFLDSFNENLGTRHAIYLPFLQAVPRVAVIDKIGTAPCRSACPAGVNAQGYVQLITQKKYKEALALEMETNPLPGICGRICMHPCESECNRKEIDSPVAIAHLKRYIADWAREHDGYEIPEVERDGDKVAIVGAGPAGLAAAYRLALKGHSPTIYDENENPGGMMAYGIPEYRLPRDILNYDIDAITSAGIDMKSGVRVGDDITLEQLQADHDAIFIAVGAWKSYRLNIEGEDLNGVMGGVEFLRAYHNDDLESVGGLGEKVAVIGGGNSAMDSARVATRLGKDVTILYRRTYNEMPASEEEIEEAKEEGIKIEFLTSPKRILGEDGTVTGLEMLRMELGEPDESGRRRPIPIEGSEYTLEFDTVIPAISQQPQLDLITPEAGIETTKWNTIEVDSCSGVTSVEGVFAGGDVVSGPSSVIEAIAQGNIAADNIDLYLRGEPIATCGVDLGYISTYEDIVEHGQYPETERTMINKVCAEDRMTCFEEVAIGYTEEEAIREAGRCLSCGGCCECMECVKACEPDAIVHDMEDRYEKLNVEAIILATGFDVWDPSGATEYGYGKYPNIYTAMEFERLISASGPTGGHLQRRSDGERPKRIGFIQCVGSRNPQLGHDYCCSVCCMHATKEALLANEHHDDIESFIFYKDLRAFGKGFFEYTERAKRDYKVTYINSDATVENNPENNNPIVVYDVAGRPEKKEVDMVVLATTLVPSEGTKALAEVLGIDQDQFGFFECGANIFHPTETTRRGVFIAGYCAEPMDIPESVAQASGAAAGAAEIIYGGA